MNSLEMMCLSIGIVLARVEQVNTMEYNCSAIHLYQCTSDAELNKSGSFSHNSGVAQGITVLVSLSVTPE